MNFLVPDRLIKQINMQQGRKREVCEDKVLPPFDLIYFLLQFDLCPSNQKEHEN